MVFPVDGNSKLIDFDLADYVAKPYPIGCYDQFLERHNKAKGGKPREIIHNRYSFISIVTNNVYLNSQQTCSLREGVGHLSDLLEV